MKPTSSSIVRRLVLTSFFTLPLFLGLTGYAIDRAHSRSLMVSEESRLQLQFYGILGVMEWNDTQPISVERLREPRFWQFRSGLYAFIHSSNGRLQWRSSSSNAMESLTKAFRNTKPGQAVFDIFTDDNLQDYFRYQFHVIWEDDNGLEFPLVFTLLEDQTVYHQEVLSFRTNLVTWLSIAALLLLSLQIGTLRWGLRPLRALAQELRALEDGNQERLSQTYPTELTGITRNLNRLLEKEQSQRERYRNTLGNLAHSLKTPLSVMRTTLTDRPDPLVAEQLDKMGNIIAYQLQRAVSTGPQSLGAKTELHPLALRLINSLKKVYRDKAMTLSLECAEDLTLPIDQQDLLELLGNLLDNACKAAKHHVQLQAERCHDNIELIIDDDGPGFPADKLESYKTRGKRGDEYGSGQGLGLAVVSDILDAYKAQWHIESSPFGGARIRLVFPLQS